MRKIHEQDISIFDFIIDNYSFTDLNKDSFFRVKDTEDTYPCSRCKGRKEITCSKCAGEGKNTCPKCDGKGQMRCSACRGRGETKCFNCGGKGSRTSGSGENQKIEKCSSCSNGYVKCRSCNGGWTTCSTCSGNGRVICQKCSGRGQVTCPFCNGNGYFNEFLVVKSTIDIKDNIQFLKGIMDFLEDVHQIEEFKYDKNFSYPIKELSDYTSYFTSILKMNLYLKELSKAKEINKGFKWHPVYEDANGRLNIQDILDQCRTESTFFISGPPIMIKSFKEILLKSGVKKTNILTDDWE